MLVAGPVVSDANRLERPVVVNGTTVGFVAVPGATFADADLRFLRDQLNASWGIAALALLVSAGAAMALAHGLLAPIRKLARATHRLATGDYDERIRARSRDELGQLVRDFNALADALQSADQRRRDFVADISHELRTPLAILRGEIEALQDGVRTVTPDTLKSLQAEVVALGRLVDDLRGLALADAEAVQFDLRPAALHEVVAAAVRAFGERARAAGLAIVTHDLDVPAVVDADPPRLTQVFNNVLENAVRYTDRGGRIELRIEPARNAILVQVDDTAPGVPDADLPRLFERLFRVERSRTRASGGAGLGLALARSVMRGHHGEIAATHSPLGGLRVTLTFPRSQTEDR